MVWAWINYIYGSSSFRDTWCEKSIHDTRVSEARWAWNSSSGKSVTMLLVSPWGAVGPCHLRWPWGRMQGVYLNRRIGRSWLHSHSHWFWRSSSFTNTVFAMFLLTLWSHSSKCFIRHQFLGPLLLLVCNLQLWGLAYLFLCDCFVSTL